MALGTNYMRHFYDKKSIIHSYNFYVDLSLISSNVLPHHVLDVDIPTNKFQRESVNYGVTQFSYPVLSKDQPLDIKITFEEDNKGTIGTFLNGLQTKVANAGLHNTIDGMRLGDIQVELYDDQKKMICLWLYKNVFFLGYDNVSLAYDSNDTVKYTATFGSDAVIFQPMWTKLKNAKPLVQGGLAGVIGGLAG